MSKYILEDQRPGIILSPKPCIRRPGLYHSLRNCRIPNWHGYEKCTHAHLNQLGEVVSLCGAVDHGVFVTDALLQFVPVECGVVPRECLGACTGLESLEGFANRVVVRGCARNGAMNE